jgi:hypothetical protein
MATLTLRGRLTPRTQRLFANGSITLTQVAAVRVETFSPKISFYRGKVEPGYHGMVPFNLRSGRIGIRVVTGRNLLPTHSPSVQFTQGSITVTPGGIPAVGALSEFAIWPTSLGLSADPVNYYFESATNTSAGGVNQPWTRINTVFVPHKKARYVGVGAKFYGVPATGVHRNQFVKKVMLEKAYLGGTYPTTPYSAAREVEATVRPSRVNYLVNPSFEVDLTGWLSGAGGTLVRDTTRARSGSASGRITAVSAGNVSVLTNVTTGGVPVTQGRSLSAKIYVQPATLTRTVRLYFQFYGPDKTALVNSTSQDTVETTNDWTPALLENILVPAGAGYATLVVQILGAGAGEVHYIDNGIIEKAAKTGEYFDGSTSGDTIWEVGGTVGSTRSYLYPNRAARATAIKRILQNNVPMGIGVGDPSFGVLPVESGYAAPVVVTGSSTLYGAGLYGSGPYGG